MDVHELIRVFLKEENRKELSLYAYMLMGNKNDALDLLSDLLIEIYENPKMQDAIDPIPYFKTVLHNMACNIKKRNSRMIPHDPNMLSGTEPKLYDDTEREHEDMRARQEWLNRLLISYSPEIADAFLRCYMDGYSVKELAAELNMSENALSQQFCRMRKNMFHEKTTTVFERRKNMKKILSFVLVFAMMIAFATTAFAAASTISVGGTVTGGAWRSQGSQPSYHNYECDVDVRSVSFSGSSTSLKFGIYVNGVLKSDTPRIVSPYVLTLTYTERLSGVTLNLRAYSGSSSSGSATYSGKWTN